MIAENLNKIQNKINNACLTAGRNPVDIRLIAVTKTVSVQIINDAVSAGLKEFGENKAQDLFEKFNKLKEPVIWHFIGHLQTNKAKYAVRTAEYIHSIDSVKLAEEINKQAAKLEKIQKVLLEIKTSSEESKFGLEDENEIYRVAEYCKKADNLNPVGLMTIAPYTENQNLIRKSFIDLRNLKDTLNKQGYAFTELSMGMTSDFEIAIEEGATMIRIGSALFGERIYS